MKKKERKVYEPEQDYPKDFQIALAISLIIFIVIFLTVKSLEVKPYKPKGEVETIVEPTPQELEQIEEPPPPPKPQLPVEATEGEEAAEEEEEVEIAPTTEFNELEAPPPPKTEEVYEFYAVEVKPQIIKRYEPVYPEMAKKAGIEGQVFIKALVDETGHVTDVRVLRSTNPVFEAPAMEAARKFLFKPGYQRDKPVKVWVVIPFRFKLTK
ncbi:MAG TPA: energy transducer TonB [candidate division WOR-3 bacterium]|uniref:Energy transducer TonB n=1 Tax=candidate division WOR-3 bacterium TaxID=2052148 RepID=A0A7C0XAG8_UNCW3|nr:MAG: energy transducer TonB [Candidatus Hydrothermae bacterium]HDM89864.1 energy transducer TonB [candidate division WOR-3 bacterium]